MRRRRELRSCGIHAIPKQKAVEHMLLCLVGISHQLECRRIQKSDPNNLEKLIYMYRTKMQSRRSYQRQ